MNFEKSDPGFRSPHYNASTGREQPQMQPQTQQQSYTSYYPRSYQSDVRSLDHTSQPPAYEEATYTQTDVAREDQSFQAPHDHGQGYGHVQLPRQAQRPSLPLLRPNPQSSRLDKPIAVPATVAQYGSPFLRAYPPCLASFGISAETFLSFLDTLNRVAVKSPPLQVLGLAGNIVGFVPSAAAQIAGGVINLTAEVAAGVIQHGRTEIELRRANADLFAPRGLQVEIAKTEALVKLLGVPGVLGPDGKLDKNAKLLTRLELGGMEHDGDLDISAQQRRLDALKPWIAELDVAPLPGIEAPNNALSRLSVKVSERNRAKGEKKLLEKRGKAHQEYHKEARKAEQEFEREVAKIDKERGKELREIDAKLENAGRKQKTRDVDKLEREKDKILAEYERDRTRVEKRYQKEMNEIADERLSIDGEEKSLRKLHWLVIREKDAPGGRGVNPDHPGSYVG
ncbi:hypothetical protein G647_05684 [Cladophialophora carrionii CBS 160.54]|uniref:Uncharacterized protein n=1 Tax=Cladophialophora carrionii CBS 160.54 TaxID=1279043 RepID=V9DD68_9EURO|nr:uncharacterized protein G647_05684 [Cladophialophora carrionii CBS 160.54]ETI23877.1 hypothetical protein G647_05684 [Cladophialophora carrionii CBS 160.54]